MGRHAAVLAGAHARGGRRALDVLDPARGVGRYDSLLGFPAGAGGCTGRPIGTRRETYKEPGRRARDEYMLTESGRNLDLVLAALQQWGDDYLPSSVPTITYRDRNGAPLKVSFVDRDGQPVAQENARAHRPSPSGTTQRAA
jgi:HxlR-like helix-turn-helix